MIGEIVALATTVLDNWPEIVLTIENIQEWIIAQISVIPTQAMDILNSYTERILTFIQNFSRNLLNFGVR